MNYVYYMMANVEAGGNDQVMSRVQERIQAEVDALPSVVNLGTGRARTVAEVVRVLGDHFPDMVCVHEGASTLPYEASEADLSRFTALTRWSPEYDLERAIPEIIAYERGQLENGSR